MDKAEKLAEQGEFTLARQCFEKILEDVPDHLEAMNNLAVILFQEGRTAEAYERFHEVLRMDPANADARANVEMMESLRREATATERDRSQPLNIGFISIWFERGQSYVTKMIRDAVAFRHETFVFARTGSVGDQSIVETSGSWAVPNLTVWPRYDIPSETIHRWIKDNHLDVVVFNEEYDWNLVKAVKQTGVKTMTYLDYYKDDWQTDMGLYDAVLCSTRRTYNLVKDTCCAYYIGWGVDTDLFRLPDREPPYTFFHNAGWLGINYRKMTPAVIAAFNALSKVHPGWSLFIHSQAALDMLPPMVADIVKANPRIVYHVETLPAPGLYHMGKIMVFPTKLEGLGLPLFEGLSCGLPVITTNAPPMNEFIRHGYNGLLVDIAFRTTRDDNVAFPEEIVDMADLAVKMALLAGNDKALRIMSNNARRYAEGELAFSLLSERIISVFKEVC